MWERGRVELAALHITPLDWFCGWQKRIERGDAVSFGDAILGCERESPGIVQTHFQATKKFEQSEGRRITREMRQAIPKLMQGRGIKEARVYSLCVDDSAPKWFRLLGFVEDPLFAGKKYGDYVMRRFIRRG